MSKRLPVPPELESLIEKREADTDRRSGERRKRARHTAGSKSVAQPERRQKTNRRKKGRRKA
jgi:hypothetical protein